MTILTAVLLPPDTTANRPAAGSVGDGTLFPSTDDLIIYQSDGVSTWSTWADFSGGGGGGGGIGATELIYRYTVTGSDKLSIDTGADTPDAGSNDWTGGDLLEIYLYGRTDESVAGSTIDIIVNNDSGSNYDRQSTVGNNASTGSSASVGQAKWQIPLAGASHGADSFGFIKLEIPNFAGTVGFKAARASETDADATAGNAETGMHALQWRSTSAITRIAFAPDTSGKKFKVGSQLLIYKRLSS